MKHDLFQLTCNLRLNVCGWQRHVNVGGFDTPHDQRAIQASGTNEKAGKKDSSYLTIALSRDVVTKDYFSEIYHSLVLGCNVVHQD